MLPKRKPHDRTDDLVSSLPLLLSVSQLAEELQLSVRHTKRLIAEGRIRSYKLTASHNGAVRVHRDAVAEFLRATAA